MSDFGEAFINVYTIETSLLFSLRCVKLLESIKEMLLSFPINDPTNEEMFAKLEKIRAKFRQVTYVHCTVKSCHFSNAYICMCIEWSFKETILLGNITRSEMGKQN